MRALALLGILAVSEVIWLIVAGPQTQPSPATQPTTREMPMQTETATVAAGCFWGVQSTFEKIPGVISTRVGYTGGTMPNPTYEDVCTDRTGHAESIEIVFDPQKLSYQTLLNIFFDNHDPTTMNRQGPDAGTQYNSVIFYHSPQQKALAEAEKKRRNDSGQYVGPLVTRIVPAGPFYSAEEYHQFYNDKHGITWTCHTGNGKRH